jgi:hypothetical protein
MYVQKETGIIIYLCNNVQSQTLWIVRCPHQPKNSYANVHPLDSSTTFSENVVIETAIKSRKEDKSGREMAHT